MAMRARMAIARDAEMCNWATSRDQESRNAAPRIATPQTIAVTSGARCTPDTRRKKLGSAAAKARKTRDQARIGEVALVETIGVDER
jgi:hypothetical protein